MAFLSDAAIIEKVRAMRKVLSKTEEIVVKSKMNFSFGMTPEPCYIIEIDGVKYVFTEYNDGILMEANEFWSRYRVPEDRHH